MTDRRLRPSSLSREDRQKRDHADAGTDARQRVRPAASASSTAVPDTAVPDTAMPAHRETLDLESLVSHDDHEALRLWLRLLTCTTLIESRIRARLRRQFQCTLPRFDLLAQLARHPDGMRMGELSKRLMVTSGNVTGITDQLVREGFITREEYAGDRRAYRVRLTEAGARAFDEMARAHEGWVVETFAAMPASERRALYALLARLKTSVPKEE